MNNTYFKHMVEFDFRKYTSVAQLSTAGLVVTDGWQIGATAPNGAVAWGSPKNIRFSSTDGMLLVVPGGQTAKGHVSAAEVTFNNADKGMTKMYIEAEIQVDSKTGTCQSMFTYALDYENNFDEHDIEVIAASLMSPSKYAPAGVQLTNFSPDGSGKNQYKIVPFSSNPSVGFHKYNIAWDRKAISYSFDGKKLAGPTKYVAKNPSTVLLNNWATGDLGFFGAALPKTEVVMKVRSLKVYYETKIGETLPSSCRAAAVCQA